MLYVGWVGWYEWDGWSSQVIGLLRASSELITIQQNDNTTNHYTQVHTMDKEPPPADPK